MVKVRSIRMVRSPSLNYIRDADFPLCPICQGPIRTNEGTFIAKRYGRQCLIHAACFKTYEDYDNREDKL